MFCSILVVVLWSWARLPDFICEYTQSQTIWLGMPRLEWCFWVLLCSQQQSQFYFKEYNIMRELPPKINQWLSGVALTKLIKLFIDAWSIVLYSTHTPAIFLWLYIFYLVKELTFWNYCMCSLTLFSHYLYHLSVKSRGEDEANPSRFQARGEIKYTQDRDNI